MNDFTVHPLAERFPEMQQKDFDDLKESIRKYGLFEPVIVNDRGQILDGRHRHRALIELGRPLKAYQGTISFEEIKGSNKDLTEEQFIYDANIHRRHLTDDQRVALATVFAPFFKKEGEERKAEGVIKGGEVHCLDPNSSPSKRDIETKHANSTVGKVAEKAGVSEYKAAQALAVSKDPELVEQVIIGAVALKDAAKSVQQPRSWTAPKVRVQHTIPEKVLNRVFSHLHQDDKKSREIAYMFAKELMNRTWYNSTIFCDLLAEALLLRKEEYIEEMDERKKEASNERPA